MDQPQRTRWTLSLAAGILILIVVVAVAVMRSRDVDRVKNDPVVGETIPAPAPLPPSPLPPPAIRRGELINAAARAAAAYAAGEPYPAETREIVGRPFEIIIPFGCSGPSATATSDPARWNFDLKNRSITLSAQPQDWTDASWARAIAGSGEYERIEGFWIPRPWLASESCPMPRAPDPAMPPPQPANSTVGLVRLFGTGASRVTQRGARPYEVVRKASEAELSTTRREFSFVISGRLAAFPTGEAVRCHGASIDQRPVCLTAVEIDRAAFVDPSTGEVLAEWQG